MPPGRDPATPGRAWRYSIEVEGPLEQAWPPKAIARLFGDLDFKKATLADAEKVLREFAPRAFRRPMGRRKFEPYLDLVKEQFDARPAVRGGDPRGAEGDPLLAGVSCS